MTAPPAGGEGDGHPRDPGHDETAAVAQRYARRAARDPGNARYSLLQPAVWQAEQERERALIALWRRLGWRDLSEKHLLDVGCGHGGNLLGLLRMGFDPAHLTGIELLPERHAHARRVLPAALRLIEGDALAADIAPGSQDVVYQSVVFSSLLDEAFQQRLADAMWRWVRPGGGVLWYDFAVDNPRNPDVRGVSPARVRALFPEGRVQLQRLTLAPPLARAVTYLHPALYRCFNLLPLLRTHRLAWIAKPAPARL